MSYYSIEDYVNLKIPENVWLWDGILPVSGATLLFAKQKIGKSFLALSLCEAIADPNIDQFLGQGIFQHGKVLYIQLDTPRGLWIKNYITNVKSKAARENIFIVDRELEDIPLPFDIRAPKCQEWVRTIVNEIKPVLVVIDTFRRMHRCDENDNTEMSIIYDTFVNITKPAAMLILTHEKKIVAEGADAAARGATSVLGAVDSLVNMTKKRLKIEARSDIEEEIQIFQQDNGTFSLNSKGAEIEDFIANMEARGAKAADITKQLSENFKVSERTARRWRKK
jgi:RecA-family ATPase